jgi:hypothetical protein
VVFHNPWPRLQFPDAFLKHCDGIGTFLGFWEQWNEESG